MARLPEDQSVDQIGSVLADRDEDDIKYGSRIEGRCNAKINANEQRGLPDRRCKHLAGYRTEHPGYGSCIHHFGRTPQVQLGAVRAMYEAEYAGVVRFGQVLEVDPMSGILTEIGRTNGFIAFLERKIGEKAQDGTRDPQLVYIDSFGNQHPEPAVLIWRAERAHFARCCKMAADIGVSAVMIDMAKVMGDRIVDLLEDVLRDLGKDPDDPEVGRVVQRRLALVGDPDAKAV